MSDFAGNAYPNADNYPEPSFPEGSVSIPLIDPDEGELITVQYSPVWQPWLMSAVNQLLQYSTWDVSHDDKIQTVNQAAYLKWLLRTPVDVSSPTVPTPYWDDDTSVDDEELKEIQEWYGEVEDANAAADELTFVENAVIWILTGFVATAAAPTLGGAAAAAIFFRTTAVRFVLAFNKGDVGEAIRVVIDGADYGNVDTSELAAEQVIELEVNGLADTPTHDIMIITKPVP